MEAWGVEHGVVSPVRAAALSRAHVRDAAHPWGEWRRSSRGFYVPAHLPRTPLQRVAEAGALIVPPAAITGWGALVWQGGQWFEGLEVDGTTPLPVDLAQPRRLARPQPLVRLCQERSTLCEVRVVDGLRVTCPVRAATFTARYAPGLRAAVRALSMAAYDDLVSLAEAGEWAAWHPSYTGIEQCRQAVRLADENLWSPAEADHLLDWEELTGTRPLTNRPLFDLDGRHLATPDLIDPRTGVCGEYDGPRHLDEARRAADLRREDRLRAHGLHPVTMVRSDRRGPSAWPQRVRAAYAAAERTPATSRRWTLEPPDWWVPTWTVAMRRALSPEQRRIWLAHRTGPDSR